VWSLISNLMVNRLFGFKWLSKSFTVFFLSRNRGKNIPQK
jgi:hypothetical protein